MVNPAYRETQQAIEKVFEKQIFFIAGVLKSGTTWVQFLLDAHPEICCKGEGHFVDKLYPNLQKALGQYNRLSAKRDQLFERAGIKGQPVYFSDDYMEYVLATIVGLILLRWLGGANAKCIGDKTPENIDGLGILDAMFPAAKYVHIVRDGRDAAVAAWIMDFQRNRDAVFKKFRTFDKFIEEFAKMWARRIGQAQDFGAANPDRFIELRYEDLHREPEPIVRGLFEFLGVDAADRMVCECIHAASFERLTDGRRRGQEQTGAHMRKGIVGDWRNHFDEAAQATFHKQAGDLLKELGYDD